MMFEEDAMKNDCNVYYSPCPNNGHFILFDPAAPDFGDQPLPAVLETDCPVCGRKVRLEGQKKGRVSSEDHERLWSLTKPHDGWKAHPVPTLPRSTNLKYPPRDVTP
jgi:hypothetical protein